MSSEIVEIANRIRELREACGYTKEQLAAELGLDADVYAAYEDNGYNIPISTIYEIAKKFKVDFNVILTGDQAHLDTYHVVRRGDGKNVSRYPGYFFEDLAYKYKNKVMQPLLVTLSPSDKSADLVAHKGQEFNMILEGTVAVVFEEKEIILNPGDSIYFNPEHPHGQRCVGDEKARFLTVITE